MQVLAQSILMFIAVTCTLIQRQGDGYKGVGGYRVICMIQAKVIYYSYLQID